jgi:thiol-disulfide isomerase/thioredoxin
MPLPTRVRRPSRALVAGAVLALALAACGTAADSSSTDAASTSAATAGDGATGASPTTGDAGGEDTVASPVLGITATAPDGATFTPADFAGQPVIVETFATWCSNCRRQLGDTQQAATELGDDAVVLALSVETSLDPADLTVYAEANGFTDVRFGVLDAAALATLKDRFGNSVLNPPSTPKFLIAPDGTVGEMTTGPESADELVAAVDATRA